MTGSEATSARAPVRWLVAQTISFGITAALLGVVANALFLDAYGARWLPVTYVFIALAGLLVSATVAPAVQRWSLVRVATFVLGGAGCVFAAAWLIAAGLDGAWVSAPLLVLFPVWIQLGFVLVGGQAGRILDIQGIKASFPRIMAGFPLGAVAGGLAAGALVSALGQVEDLLLVTAAAQGAFLALLVLTGRRFAATLSSGAASATSAPPRSPPHAAAARALVVAIFAYQVLSAVGSQLADFLVFDRAAARYGDGEELARFIARYTTVMNIVSIAFLVLAAGVLLRRFGLRFGLLANPAVLTMFAVAMVVATVAGGSGSLALFAVVAATRVADIALTDGTTRTSINATYQLLPDADRLAVQARVEGVGVPLAIGCSGVLILLLDALPYAVPALVVATLVASAVWTLVAAAAHRRYVRSLLVALDRRWLRDEPLRADESEARAARDLLAATSGPDVLVGFDLLGAMSSPAPDAELARLAADERVAVRLAALEQLAGAGAIGAPQRLATEIGTASASRDVEDRLAAARALAGGGGDRIAPLRRLLHDADPRVRAEALDAVGRGDGDVIELVIDALADRSTTAAAARALVRLGAAAEPATVALLRDVSGPVPPGITRLVSAFRGDAPPAVSDALRALLRHSDRAFGLAVLHGLTRATAATDPLARDVRAVLHEDIAAACRVVAAASSVEDPGGVLHRALRDELDLLRECVAAALRVIHGSDRLDPVLRSLSHVQPTDAALALEALGATLPRWDATVALALLRADAPHAEQLAGLVPLDASDRPTDWLADLVDDPDDRWRSPWLRACALYTARVQGLDIGSPAPIDDPDVAEVLAWSGPDG